MAFSAEKLIFNLFRFKSISTELWILGNSRLVLRKIKQLLSNFEAERWENLSNLRLAKKSVAYKKNSSVRDVTWLVSPRRRGSWTILRYIFQLTFRRISSTHRPGTRGTWRRVVFLDGVTSALSLESNCPNCPTSQARFAFVFCCLQVVSSV